MKQPAYYCKSWFRAKKKPTELWSDEKAEAADRTRRTYTALVGSAERPLCFVDVADNVIVVSFLDNPHRVETATSSFDPAPNYEVWPDFGAYDQLIRVERR